MDIPRVHMYDVAAILDTLAPPQCAAPRGRVGKLDSYKATRCIASR